MTTLVSLPVSKLEVGKIVWTNGMRVRLLTKDSREQGDRLPVFWYAGEILNVDEVNENGIVPKSWRIETRPQYVGTAHYSEKPDRWTIQSNDLQSWSVEADSIPA
jgi:hypothetical protein